MVERIALHPDLDGLLLGAGRGTRLRPLTDLIPKPALPILDLPLGAFGASALAAVCRRVIVNVSHLPEAVTGALSTWAPEVVTELPQPYGTGGTVRALSDRGSRRMVTYNSDLLTDLGLERMLAAHEASGATATIAVEPVDTLADFEMTARGELTSFVDRRREGDRAGGRFIGVGIFESDALSLLESRRPLGLTEGLIAPLVAAGRLRAHLHEGYACDVGTIDRYLRASLDVLEARGPRLPARLPGRVVDVPGGRAYLGPDVEADESSLRAGAILLVGSVVAPGARIERAIVWPGEKVPPVEVSDAVWARGEAHPAT